MSLAQENGWHVLLDASALGAKDLETLGLSLFNPDFLICSFFKVFGENPSGFYWLFIRKSSASILKDLATGTNIVGIMNLVPASPPISNIETKLKVDNVLVQQMDDKSGTEKKTKTVSFSEIEEELPDVTTAQTTYRLVEVVRGGTQTVPRYGVDRRKNL
ncbi:hypothetical protein GOBAR_DD12229 [Gossypium barbadense]|nr:hypothetical protein GOBAR_DD12229 [Gossypium barbadense]